MLNSNITSVSNARYTENGRINVYVGSDSKLHFVNRDGADTALNFSSGLQYYIGTWIDSYGGRYDEVNITIPTSVSFINNIKFCFGFLQMHTDDTSATYNPSATLTGTPIVGTVKGAGQVSVTTVYERYNCGSYIIFG